MYLSCGSGRMLADSTYPRSKRWRSNPSMLHTHKKGRSSFSYTHKENAFQVPSTQACDSRLGRIYITGRSNVGKQNKPKKIKQQPKNPSKRLQPADDPEKGWAICTEKWFIRAVSHPVLPFLGTLPARPKVFIHKTRGIVSGVTLGQPLSVTNSSQACFSR